MGRVYAVASAKGGVGKTTTTANLGALLAANGHRTAVVDVDLGMANLADVVGVDPDTTLHDVLAGEADLEEAVYEGPNGLAVLPGAPDLAAFQSARPEGIGDVVETLRGRSDYVLLDVGAGLSHDTVLPLDVADEVVLVSTPDAIALEGAKKTGDIAERLGTPVAGLAVVGGEAADLDVATLASIPDAPEMDDAIEAGVPLVVRDPDAPASRAYRRLAAALAGEDALDTGSDADRTTDTDAEDEDAATDAEGAATHDENDDPAVDADDGPADDGAEGSPADADDAPEDGVTFESDGTQPTPDAEEGVVDEAAASDDGGDGRSAGNEAASSGERADSGCVDDEETEGGVADEETEGGVPLVADEDDARTAGDDEDDDTETGFLGRLLR